MKTNELMIGDFIYQHHPKDNTPHIVKVSVDTLDLMDRMKIGFIQKKSPLYRIIEPIPLTQEILEKNGFEKQQGYIGSVFAFDDDDKDAHVLIHPKEDNYTRGAYTYIHVEHGCLSLDELPLEYIHELQHVFKLCGIEKEINL